jgi:hypothetical protein
MDVELPRDFDQILGDEEEPSKQSTDIINSPQSLQNSREMKIMEQAVSEMEDSVKDKK